MSSTQIEAQAPSGTVLAFRPRTPAPLHAMLPAPGWVPDEMGLFRAVLLATAMTAMMAGGALTLLAGPSPAPASRATPVSVPLPRRPPRVRT